MTSDPYCYPGTDVLRNCAGIQDAAELARAESRIVAIATAGLRVEPVVGTFDLAHLKAIHQRLFGDIYPWAGTTRTVTLSKDGMPFAHPQYIEDQAAALLERLPEEDFLRGLETEVFVDRAAYLLGELNAIHPFREGNGRTQREFLRQLAIEAGYQIDWDLVAQDENIQASVHAMRADHSQLAAMLRRITTGFDGAEH